MLSFIKYLQDTLFNINIDNNKHKKSIIIFNKSVPIDNNSKLYDEINKCWKKNINDISKLYNLIDNLSQYKLYDFLIDLHKLPHYIFEIRNYILIACIILFIILILISVFFVLLYNKL
tara:strand:- start:529 stop:882 length:354 start_codon:yes stop_codon:yes gene_type:complete